MARVDQKLVRSATRALRQPGVKVGKVDEGAAAHPGLYAFYASTATWRELGLGPPRDGRPLYVGKAESTLAARDLAGHFGINEGRRQSPTGSSTVRRSLAALLAPTQGYRGRPRNPEKPSHFANYGLSSAHDKKLSAWMRRRLRVTFWPHDDASALENLETEVLQVFLPPLNLTKVQTPWLAQVKASRSVLKAQAEKAGGKARPGL